MAVVIFKHKENKMERVNNDHESGPVCGAKTVCTSILDCLEAIFRSNVGSFLVGLTGVGSIVTGSLIAKGVIVLGAASVATAATLISGGALLLVLLSLGMCLARSKSDFGPVNLD